MKKLTFQQLLQARLSRRQSLQLGLGALMTSMLPMPALARTALADSVSKGLLGFQSIPVSHLLDDIVVPPGYQAEVFFRWGDPVSDGPEFQMDASNSAADQALQAGMHHDGMDFYALPRGSNNSDHGLLVMNHEYLDLQLIHNDGSHLDSPDSYSADKVLKEQQAHGVSVIEVKKIDGHWQIQRPSTYGRRITATTPMQISGPAAGSDWIKTAADPQGLKVLGTLNNCAHGKTPWGTYLACEENFNGYFTNAEQAEVSSVQRLRWQRYHLGRSYYGWQQFDTRFDMAKEPNEVNRFGWMAEIDPYQPDSMPIKRTALGRFAHENAAFRLTRDQRVVVYSGDDARFEYIYKYVSHEAWDGTQGSHHGHLLDNGVLYVAQLHEDGSGQWLPLVWGQGPLTADNGFADQADVLVHARLAADALGATPMDRPEWIASHPELDSVFVSLTNNVQRGSGDNVSADAANPRNHNLYGHIVRIDEADPAALNFGWEVFALAGGEEDGGTIDGDIYACPDGMLIDDRGVLWVQTDIADRQLNSGDYAKFGNNQMLAVDARTGETRRFLTGPVGCEITGAVMAPDMKALWVNIQHPGSVPDVLRAQGVEKSPQNPRASSNWPDHHPQGRPRSATVLVTKHDGGVIGT
ncbi:phosphatase [Methylophaga lonarensis MPL]|uniref:Phosphatase n=1 Tax=Methylophaga lonarensis MPL TaxID=1286106 RepID=M7NY44_9GAMM|nr:PhoX family phosphatase [Methylophaga lonarensis]EMR12136.1 phosphatase [Methylophaga lonarensis MPL]